MQAFPPLARQRSWTSTPQQMESKSTGNSKTHKKDIAIKIEMAIPAAIAIAIAMAIAIAIATALARAIGSDSDVTDNESFTIPEFNVRQDL